MQMGEASEHRPGDYGRWESSLWSPWHRGSHFGRSSSPAGAGEEGRRMDRVAEERERRRREKEGRACHGIIPSHAPLPYPHLSNARKGRNKSISGVSGICVIYSNK